MPTHSNLRFAASLALIGALGPSAIDMYLASLPQMARDFGTGYPQVQLTLTVFLLAMGAGQLLFGPLVDALGRRRPLLVGLLVFTLTSLAAAAANSLETLLLARLIQGLASALTLVVIMSMVRDVADGVRAAQIFALLMTIEGLAPILAPALGGVVDAAWGWRAIMLVLAGLGLLTLLNSALALGETLPVTQRVRLAPRSVLRTYARIARDGTFLRPALALSAVFFFLFAYIAGSAYVYQQYFGLTSTQFGMLFGACGVAILLGAAGSGLWVKRHGVARVAWWGALCMGAGALLTVVGGGLPVLLGGVVLALFGLGICEATLMALAMSSQHRDVGSTAALLGALQLVISSSATPLAGHLATLGPQAWAWLLAAAAVVILGLTRAALAKTISASNCSVNPE
ncbi:multidrug effflux MFS transporter [Pseudomonas sp. EMN2]|uniref:multidrug effflux MFS transporter n=1 Tax=Pseudomonas sp. EMN2 TaxID=2615212 RepID=UPI00129B4CD5|nr:multidrug effflux MFS transporter [Pseudomonas sp. EMN2]